MDGNVGKDREQLSIAHDELTGIMRKNKSLGLIND